MILAVFVFTACDKDDEKNDGDSSTIVGYWVYQEVNDSIMTYKRVDRLKDNDYGFAFNSNHVFIERKNSGWCGTPPVSYADYEGTWVKTDSIVHITVGYWGGSLDYKWKVISVDNKELTIVRLQE